MQDWGPPQPAAALRITAGTPPSPLACAVLRCQVAAFVDRFMPAYRCYLPGLYGGGPTTASAGHLLVVEVDEGRELAAAQPAPIM